jgi:hypothetical protein
MARVKQCERSTLTGVAHEVDLTGDAAALP